MTESLMNISPVLWSWGAWISSWGDQHGEDSSHAYPVGLLTQHTPCESDRAPSYATFVFFSSQSPPPPLELLAARSHSDLGSNLSSSSSKTPYDGYIPSPWGCHCVMGGQLCSQMEAALIRWEWPSILSSCPLELGYLPVSAGLGVISDAGHSSVIQLSPLAFHASPFCLMVLLCLLHLFLFRHAKLIQDTSG